jgi:serine/threonine protein kinase
MDRASARMSLFLDNILNSPISRKELIFVVAANIVRPTLIPQYLKVTNPSCSWRLSNLFIMKGIIHGDVKPTNWVASPDQTGRLRFCLIDFGTSLFENGNNQENVGSVYFMSHLRLCGGRRK